MNKQLQIISFLLLSTITQLMFAQTYNFKNYNTEQGLAQSQVLAIHQDVDGNMWFGTNSGGVSKFDGNKFYNYTVSNGLVSNFVFSIAQTHNNELLFGTDKGLSVFNAGKFVNYTTYNYKPLPQIFKIISNKTTNWLGTEQGVFIYENNQITAFTEDKLLQNSSVFTLFADNNNGVWFGTTQNGLIYYNLKTKAFKHFNTNSGLYNNYIQSITQNKNNDILIGTPTGLNVINTDFLVLPGNFIPEQFLIGFRSILSTTTNGQFFGTSSSGLINYNNGKLKNFSLKNGLTNNSILSLFEDREKNIWIGTNGVGLYKYSGDCFTSYSTQNNLPENYINTIAQNADGSYWLGLRNHGIVKIANGIQTTILPDFKKNNTIPDLNVNIILPATNGQLFIGTESGLCYNQNNKYTLVTGLNFFEKYILTLYEDSKHTIWIGTTDGLYTYQNNTVTQVTEINKLKQGDVPLSIYSIIEGENGNIFISTTSGLFKLGNKSLLKIDDIKPLVISAIKDYKNNIWFGTEEGLFEYNNINFKKITDTENRLSNTINFLQTDNYRRLLVGTNAGVQLLNLNDYYTKNTIKVQHFGKEDGLIGLESNFNASFKDKTGRILIGTTTGLAIYDPHFDTKNTIEALTKITDVKLFFGQENIFKYSQVKDSTLTLPQQLKLPFNKNHITFSFIGVSLTAPEKVLYSYKLEGLDDEWSPASNKTEATFSSLQPGSYKFSVKSSNNDGLWNKTPVCYEFDVLAPWYRTWWFYTLCIITVIGSIVIYNNYKTQKLIADKQKLEQIVTIRTSELRNEKEKVEAINKEVFEQKAVIEHKNIEITDSIKYAKNIQEALLPNLKELDSIIENNFVLYMPKDIVSGDFYWFTKQGNTSYIAAVDCTGHGVPGAFMSIVGNTLLNEIVNNKKITNPGEILLELHKGVKVALHQSNQEGERRDGMDMVLCAITKNTNTIQYAGANRPLWIYRKNNNYELEIIKATKYPIGGLELEENRIYENHTINVESGDSLFLFSDGYADQFGGPKGKKFMVTNMQKTILDVVNKPLLEQKQHLKTSFIKWRNNNEQVDDVLVIGIRI